VTLLENFFFVNKGRVEPVPSLFSTRAPVVLNLYLKIMHLSPECLYSLKNRGKTNNALVSCRITYGTHVNLLVIVQLSGLLIDKLQDEEVEHRQYNSELDTISKFYPDKTSEIGQKVVKWQKDFKASIVLLFNSAV
jgi:hypothetical protein